MSFQVPANKIPLSSISPSSLNRRLVVVSENTEPRTENYMKLGVAGKATAVTSEDVSVKGMVNPPVATNFVESKTSLNELSAIKGDFSKVLDIDLCGFLSRLPEIDQRILAQIDIDLGKKEEVTPTINDIMVAVNGVTLPALQVDSGDITDIVGKIDLSFTDIGAVIQGNIFKITCGKRAFVDISLTGSGAPVLGAAFSVSPTVVDSVIPEPVPYGTDPNIIIESPDVTVRSLDDTIDSGEF